MNDDFRQEFPILRQSPTLIRTFRYLSVPVLIMFKLVQVILKVKTKATMNPIFGILIRPVFILMIPTFPRRLKTEVRF